MKKLMEFFHETPLKRQISTNTPFFFEKATRQFFYKISTHNERYSIIRNYIDFLTGNFTIAFIKSIYSAQVLALWGSISRTKIIIDYEI